MSMKAHVLLDALAQSQRREMLRQETVIMFTAEIKPRKPFKSSSE